MPIRPQLINPLPRHLFQHSLATRQQRHNHIPPVVPRPRPPHKPIRLQPVHELHSTVMFECEPIRQRPNRRRLPLRQPANHQQHEILLRLQPRSSRSAIALAQKLPDLMPQFRQRPILFRLNLGAHFPSISHHDTLSRVPQIPFRINQQHKNGSRRDSKLPL